MDISRIRQKQKVFRLISKKLSIPDAFEENRDSQIYDSGRYNEIAQNSKKIKKTKGMTITISY